MTKDQRYTRAMWWTLLAAFLSALCVAWADGAPPKVYKGTVIEVHDGDTYRVRIGRTVYKVRLFGVDAPELASGNRWPDQPDGVESRDAAAKLLKGKDVTLTLHGESYGRMVASVVVGDTDVALELVEQGHAWVDERYTRNKELLAAQEAAKEQNKGQWRLGNPVTPPDWRKGKRQ